MKLKYEILLSKFGEQAQTKWNENYVRKHFESVKDGLVLFERDPLIYKPGTDYEYSSLAYSLVSRVIEETSGKDYISHMIEICRQLGLENTCVDLNNPIILNRGRYVFVSFFFFQKSICTFVRRLSIKIDTEMYTELSSVHIALVSAGSIKTLEPPEVESLKKVINKINVWAFNK